MSQTILIADDSKTVRTIVKMAFKASGYDVAEQGEGANVLSTVQSTRPDILILDYFFPDADGYELCRELKENPATADIPLLMLGGKYKQFNEGLARTSGADSVLTKPFKTDALLQAVEEAKAKAAENAVKRGPRPAGPPPTAGATRFAATALAPQGAPPAPIGSAQPNRFGTGAPAAPTPGIQPGGAPPFGSPAGGPPFVPAGNSSATFAPPATGFGAASPGTAPPSAAPQTPPSQGFGAAQGGFGGGPRATGGFGPGSAPVAPTPAAAAPAPHTPSTGSTGAHPAAFSQEPEADEQVAPIISTTITPSGDPNADFVRQIVREEIAAFVKDELPALVQNVLGGPIQRKLLYKMIARADERYDEVVRGAVHNQVIIEIEKLLNETN